jgi:polysaccharide export outer membrane protein
LHLKDFVKPFFIIGGEVANPGKYDLHGPMSALQAVSMVGGTENSRHSQVLLFRQFSDEWVEVITLDLNKIVQSAQLEADVPLQSGDTLFVPKSRLSGLKRYLPTASIGIFFNPFAW